MLISVVTDGSELSKYAVVKMLNSASKSWDAQMILFFLASGTGKKQGEYKKKLLERAKEADVKLKIEEIPKGEGKVLAKSICSKAESQGATGIFVPENMTALSEELKAICKDLPVEEVSSDLFPSIWDLMTKKVAAVNTYDTLKYAANLMVEKRIGSLIVMDRGRVAGILTEYDFVKAFLNGDGKDKKVKEAMSTPVVSIDRTGTIFEACELMKKHRIKKLVIMDGNQLQGIVTTTDLAKLPLSISESLNYLVSKIKDLSL